LQEHTEEGSAAAEQLGAEMARRGSRYAGMLWLDTAEAEEWADFRERVCKEVAIIRVRECREVSLG
jgi:hypothetical protein